MKYEADIIKDIVDSRGHEKSSIHYQSECVEEWVKEVEGAYPKLCDYQPEWLNYSAENKVGVFPYVALTDVASATVENVVPYAYKSAILRGQTLKNINDYSIITSSNVTIDNDGVITINAQSKYTEIFIKSLENKSSTKYLVKIKVIENTLSGDFNLNAPANGSVIFDNAFKIIKSGYVGEETIIYTTASDLTNAQFTFRSYLSSSVASGSIKYQLSVIEYQDGMENWDIPYFTGMQSVKLPVLTTTGKNLFNMNRPCDNLTNNQAIVVQNTDEITISSVESGTYVNANFILDKNLFKGKTVTGSCLYESDMKGLGAVQINYRDASGKNYYQVIKTPKTFTFPKEFIGDVLLCIYANNTGTPQSNTVTVKNIQLELGSTATSYEPYKSNILTVNEDVTLRSNGDICDELNLLTGQLTQRIDEDGEVLSQESVKTVDLSVVDQDGNEREQIKPIEGAMHLSTSGETIKPLFSGEIPVEAITQNLASFIEE